MGDKVATKERLIKAACMEFAEMGYSKARVREISKAANANLAAVNYHFGSKAKLYLAVFEYLYAETERPFQTDDLDTGNKEKCISILKDAALYFFDSIYSSDVQIIKNRILYRELVEPSEMSCEIQELFVKPRLKILEDIICGICGIDSTPEEVKVKFFAIIGQFSFYSNSARLMTETGHFDFVKDNKELIIANMLKCVTA